jgi:hypothetical protein
MLCWSYLTRKFTHFCHPDHLTTSKDVQPLHLGFGNARLLPRDTSDKHFQISIKFPRFAPAACPIRLHNVFSVIIGGIKGFWTFVLGIY